MANQKRLEILILLQKGELNVSEMMAMLAIRQANLSQHLALLRSHKLVGITRRGREIYYRLSDKSIIESIDAIHDFLVRQYNITDIPTDRSPFPFVTDPICGMRMSKSDAFDTVSVDGNNVYFCASGCKATYESQHPTAHSRRIATTTH